MGNSLKGSFERSIGGGFKSKQAMTGGEKDEQDLDGNGSGNIGCPSKT